MTAQQEIELHDHIKQHQSSLGCPELKRRGKLLNEANTLVKSLIKRAKTFERVDRRQYARSMRALFIALERVGRREKTYYGA